MVTERSRTNLTFDDTLRAATPLRLVERVIVERHQDRLTLRTTQTISAADPYLSGHFPGFPIFPGVFMLEGLRQAVVAALGESEGQLPEILVLRSVRFLAPVLPGDELTLDATVEPSSEPRSFEVEARCRRSDGVTAARFKVNFGYGGLDGA